MIILSGGILSCSTGHQTSELTTRGDRLLAQPKTLILLLKQLCDQGLLKRFDNGVFYIPSQLRLKGGIPITAKTVAKYRYITGRGKIEGHYSGYTFANQVGMTLQVPVTVEIVSNEANTMVNWR